MNKKQLTVAWVIILGLLFLFFSPIYASWTQYKPARYVDLDGDFIDEIIIETENGAGSGHYVEIMRIFKEDDKSSGLNLIFMITTLDSIFGYGLRSDEVSNAEFTEPDVETGLRDIVVKTEKIYYKDEQNKAIDRREELGTKIFKWNGKVYVENEIRKETDFDVVIDILSKTEIEDRKVDLEKWTDKKMIESFSKVAITDRYINKLYDDFKKTIVNPPKPGTYTEYSIENAEESLIKVERLGREMHNLFFALSDQDFAKYGKLIGIMRDILYIDWKHIPYAIKHNNGRDVYWYELHNMGLTEAEKEYLKFFHIGN